MTIELNDAEAREMVLVLRHFYDESVKISTVPDEALFVYVSVLAKMQDALGMTDSPWSEQGYRLLDKIGDTR